MDMTYGVGTLLNGIGGIFGMLQNAGLTDMQRDINTYLQQAGGQANGLFLSLLPALRQQLMDAGNMGQQLGIGNAENPGVLTQLMNQYPGLMQQAQSQYGQSGPNGAQQGYLDQFQQLFGQNNNLSQNPFLNSLLESGGQNASNQNATYLLDQIMGSHGAATQQGVGQYMMQNGGQTSQTSMAQALAEALAGNKGMTGNMLDTFKIAQQLAATGGMTQNSTQGQNAALGMLQPNATNTSVQNLAQSILQGGGSNPQSQMGQQAALARLIYDQGQNPQTQAAKGTALDRYMKDPLMSMQDAINISTDSASRDNKALASANAAKALGKGGGPGAVINSGMQNQALGQISDRALENVSAARQKAITDQQGLQLNQNQASGNMFNQTSGNEQQNMQIWASILQGLNSQDTSKFQAASQLLQGMMGTQNQSSQIGLQGLQGLGGLDLGRLSEGLQNALGSNQLASQNTNSGINGILGAGSQNLQGMGLGNTMNNDAFSNLLRLSQGYDQSGNGQISNLLNLLGGSQNLNQGSSNIANTGLGGYNNSYNTNLGGTNSLYNTLFSGMNQQQNLGNSFLQYQQNSWNPMTSLTNSTGNLMGQLLSSMRTPGAQQNPFQGLGNTYK